MICSRWTNFAITGDPGLGAKPWSYDEPWYSRITDVVEIASNYRNEYHVAFDQATKTTSSDTTMPVSTTPNSTISNTSVTTPGGSVTTEGSETTVDSAAMSYSLSYTLVTSIVLLLVTQI